MIRVKESAYRKGQIALHFGAKRTLHVSQDEATTLVSDLAKLLRKLKGGPFFIIALSFAMAFVGCATLPAATENGALKDFWSGINTASEIRVRGIGAAPADARGKTARRARSRVAALVAGRYELLGLVKGVRLEGGISVSQLMERDGLIKEIVDDVVRGGSEISTEWMKDDGCVVTMEIRREVVERIIEKETKRERELGRRLAEAKNEIGFLKGVIRRDYDTDEETMEALSKQRQKAEELERISFGIDHAGKVMETDFSWGLYELVQEMKHLERIQARGD